MTNQKIKGSNLYIRRRPVGGGGLPAGFSRLTFNADGISAVGGQGTNITAWAANEDATKVFDVFTNSLPPTLGTLNGFDAVRFVNDRIDANASLDAVGAGEDCVAVFLACNVTDTDANDWYLQFPAVAFGQSGGFLARALEDGSFPTITLGSYASGLHVFYIEMYPNIEGPTAFQGGLRASLDGGTITEISTVKPLSTVDSFLTSLGYSSAANQYARGITISEIQFIYGSTGATLPLSFVNDTIDAQKARIGL